MTKKRFIKLLMSHGEQRDRARTIALRYNILGASYKKAYSDYLAKTAVTRAVIQLGKTAKTLGDNLKNVAQSLKKFTEVLSNDR